MSQRHPIQLILVASSLLVQSSCQIFIGLVYSDVHYSKNTCFQLSFHLQCRVTPTLLMTPVPCNFFSVENSDYRVGVELQAKHHLFLLLFCASLTPTPQLCLSKAVSMKQCLTQKVILFYNGLLQHSY